MVEAARARFASGEVSPMPWWGWVVLVGVFAVQVSLMSYSVRLAREAEKTRQEILSSFFNQEIELMVKAMKDKKDQHGA